MYALINHCLQNSIIILLITALVINSSGDAYAQKATKEEQVIAPDLLFESFFSKNGLPDDRIRSIFQDSRGFLWIGTQNGLSRFDGYGFKKFYKSNKRNSISGNWTYAITEDKERNIWIGTKEGLNKYDVQQERFIHFLTDKNNPKSISSNVVNTLYLDNDEQLWVGTAKGLNRFDPKSKSFKRFNSYPLNTAVNKIIKSDGDFIWVATVDGVAHYNTRTNQYQFFKIKVKANAYGDRIWSMMEDTKDLFITTGGDGLIKLPYNAVTNSYSPYEYYNNFQGGELTNKEIFDICKSKRGDIWLATATGLAKITRFRDKERTIEFYKNNPLNSQSISNNVVYRVLIDQTDVLWCGTEYGLNKLDLNLLPFRCYTFTSKAHKDQIRSVATLDGQNIWLGTSKNGLYRLNTESGNVARSYFNESFFNFNRSLLVTEQAVWNGSLGGAFKVPESPGVSIKEVYGSTVFSMLRDSRSNVWLGTNNGLYKILPDGTKKIYFLEVKSDYIRSLYEDHKGNIWIGFENNTLGFFNPASEKFSFINKSKKGKVFGTSFFSITEYPENVIWAGSESGLNKISFTRDGNYSIENYFETDGLPDKSVNGIIPDGKGNLWISTIKGLAKFNIKQRGFQTYLSNLSFNASSYQKYSNQSYLFGGTNGFVMFNPDSITKDHVAPRVILTDLKLFNKSVSINEAVNGDVILKQSILNTDHISLDYYNNQFSIEFAALHYSNPLNNSYQYKLEGFDNKWTTTNSSIRSATYTNLNPGTYTFLVKASNYSGKWSNTPKSIKITILPPPWKTWWAIVLYVILFNVLLFVFVRYILIQSKQRQQIIFDRLEKEQLKNLNQMKVRFFTDVSHEFRTPLSLIIGPTEEILASEEPGTSINRKAQLIYRNCKKLLYLIDELMTFQKMEHGMLKLKSTYGDLYSFVKEVFENFLPFANKKNIHFDLTFENGNYLTAFDPSKMEMVMNNLLFNAFKFSNEGGKVSVKLKKCSKNDIPAPASQIDEWISITVEDEGKGLSAEEFSHLFERFISDNNLKGTGVGLSLTKNLVELHGGIITAESEPGINTRFNVYLPVVYLETDELTNSGYTPEYDVDALLEAHIATESKSTPALTSEQYDILVVDDNPEVLDYLGMIFESNYLVHKARNGVQALDMVKKRLPDIIISDLMMPEINGIELCNAVKSDINSSHIPFILLTAKSSVETKIEGLQTGADDYISKPFHPHILKIRVEKLLETQRRLIEKFKADGGVVIPKNIDQNPLDQLFLQKVIDNIKANLSDDEFSVEELGSAVAMSRSNLFRKLKAITGQTPIEFIYFIRLNHAMELLLERKMNMSEIAYEVGFKTPSSFTKSFKKQFGKAPSVFLDDVLNKQS